VHNISQIAGGGASSDVAFLENSHPELRVYIWMEKPMLKPWW